MASYVEGALVGNERILHMGRISLWSMWHLLLLGVLTLPLFGAGLIVLGVAWVRYKSTELAVTTKRVMVKHGFIRRKTIELNLQKVESLQVEQNLAGRMLNYGTLVFAGTGASHAPLNGIADPMAFRKAFIEAQEGLRGEA